jgi:DNA-binding SARP family transcriptional activator/tetratricopeptide (TPR) repeat protein
MTVTQLALYLLGPPRLERDGTAVAMETRKATALLAYLAISGQRHTRDMLAALLWPEYDQAHARATLRRTLSALKDAVGDEQLEIERDTIGLAATAGVWIDAVDFERLVSAGATHGHSATDICMRCQEELTQAVALYRGDFLAGFALRDSLSFEDWQFFQQQSLRRELAAALERLTRGHAGLGEYEAAILCARRWLALDRLHEPAHRWLMRLYAWVGQRSAALHQYRECARVLDQELSVAPLDATTHLYEGILENRVPVRPRPPLPAPGMSGAPSATDVSPRQAEPAGEAVGGPASQATAPDGGAVPVATPGAYPLVGRETQWQALLTAYAAATPDGHVAVLEGEAGIGKTRLAEELLATARERGARAIAVRCYAGEINLAYGPVVAALRAVAAQERAPREAETAWLVEAARILPELAVGLPGLPTPAPLESPGAQNRFMEGITRVLLGACAGTAAGVLFFDDAQWADGATLDLLTYLVHRLARHAVLLLLAWRGGEVPTEQRLRHLLGEIQRVGTATVIALPRLAPGSVAELVRAAPWLEAGAEDGLAARVYRETEGLPFFVAEYLAAIGSGALGTEAAEWSPPGGVRDLLRSRLLGVSDAGLQLLAAAAVVGRSFDFETLREVSGRSEEETIAGLEELIAQGLIQEMRDGAARGHLAYDFSHEKLRSLIYDEASLARRRLLHRRAAEALARRAGRAHGALPSQIARHELLAGNEAAAAASFRAAGERARDLYAHSEALDHFRTALGLGYPDSAGLHEAIGDALTALGEYGAALSSYATAAAHGAPGTLAGLEHKLSTVYARRGEWAMAEAHIQAALVALDAAGESEVMDRGQEDGAAGTRAAVYADWSLIVRHQGRLDQAQELAEQALALAEAGHDEHALAQAHNMLGILATGRHDQTAAQRHLERSLELAERLDDAGARAAALNNLALARSAGGDIARALTLTEEALRLCAAQGDRHHEAALHNNLADLLHAAGRADEAMEHLKQAVSIFAEIGVEAGDVQPEIWKLAEW